MERTDDTLSESLDTITLPDPLELVGSEFRHITIIGTGLIGGSIGLRLRQLGHGGIVVGHDQPSVLDEALERGAIDRGAGDLAEAVRDADLIVIATPVDEVLRLLPTVLRQAKPEALVTDTAPTKSELTRRAQTTEGSVARYLGGHPLAGSNRQGIANADAQLFDNAYWLLTPTEEIGQAARESLAWWVRLLGAYPLHLEPELHDRIMAMTTHAPFLVAVALSNWISQHAQTVPLLSKLATGNFQTMTAMAGLPLAVWQAVLQTNRTNVEEALGEIRQAVEHCERMLKEGQLAELWQNAHAFQRRLARERPGDWDANCELVVTVPDRPGTIARIASLLASHEINIRDVSVLYVRERRGGTLKVILGTRAEAKRAIELLLQHGYTARLRD